MLQHRQPPQSLESEQHVLGMIILYPECIWDISEVLDSTDFFREPHKVIYEHILALSVSSKVDIITLSNSLKDSHNLDKVGGVAYLSKLTDIIPQKTVLPAHTKEIKQKAMARRLISLCHNTIEGSYSEHPEYLINNLERELYSLAVQSVTSDFVHIKDILPAVFKDIEKRCENPGDVSGISTGYDDLDRLTAGLNNSDLIILAARPGVGKSALAVNIMQNAAKNGISSAIFSLEMSSNQLATRMVCSDSGVNLQSARTGYIRDEQWPKLTKAVGKISESDIYIDQMVDLTPQQIRAKAKRIKKTKNIGLLVIDYLGLIRTEGKSTRNDEIGEITRMLKITAKELDIPIICLCQLNRKLEERADKRPKLSDLRDSGSIEQDSDMVWFIYRDEMYNKSTPKKGIAEIIVGKQRNGPTGTVELVFDGGNARFKNLYKL